VTDDAVATAQTSRVRQAWAVLDGVLDPEVPALSLTDLGIVREVLVREPTARPPESGLTPARRDGAQRQGCTDFFGLEVVLTPTYSGCPATEVITQSVIDALDAAGLGPTEVTMRRAPAWTSDWISAEGRRKLREYGIAPPGPVAPGDGVPIRLVGRRPRAAVACPRCGSAHTEQLSAFGSTACKSLHRCLDCREPFEHFKSI
jgi:ring-1,2-phenylacetyl-CoA epoxidase subunit PaaD